MRVLFLIPHPLEGASSRYRVIQYISHLQANGVECVVSSFLSKNFYRIAYQRGHWLKKGTYFFFSSLRRLRDVLCCGRYDLVFIHLEAFPIGPPIIEWLLARCKIPIVFDLDDALFLPRTTSVNPIVEFFRMPKKIETILKLSRQVITCNDHLKEYVKKFNPNVSMIPTCVDTDHFVPRKQNLNRDKPLVGWIGSHSTAPYLEMLKPVLAQLAKKYAFTFKIVGSAMPFHVQGVEVIQENWTIEKEVAYFQELDIGVYPLPDEPWVLGKTGFKTIQYMSVGVPCIVSNIGRNREIICDGINGFMAASENDWIEKLGHLLRDSSLRLQLGLEGRKTVEKRFATAVYVSEYVDILKNVLEEK